MLTIDQIDALLKEGLRVFMGTGRDYKTVFRDEDDGFLWAAHPSDEAGINWVQVKADNNDMTTCRLQTHPGHGDFEVIFDIGARFTKVVKFEPVLDPAPSVKPVFTYVVFHKTSRMSDEEACEEAIDLLLNKGRHPAACQPILVI
jgi:hypothetical protein